MRQKVSARQMYNFRITPPTGTYKNVVLAFFDILGFKDFLESNCNHSPDFLLRILTTADFFTSSSFNVQLERRIASDSIIIWSDNNNEGLLAICNIAALLQTSLLKQGCLIRGSIVYGKHYSEKIREFNSSTKLTSVTSDEIIISPALAKAVVLEKMVISPRIIFEKNPALIHHLNQAKLLNPQFNIHHISDKNNNYIDGLFSSTELLSIAHKLPKYAVEGRTNKSMAEANHSKAIAELNQIRAAIELGLSHRDRRVVKKWNDVRIRFNKFINSCPNLTDVDKSLYLKINWLNSIKCF